MRLQDECSRNLLDELNFFVIFLPLLIFIANRERLLTPFEAVLY